MPYDLTKPYLTGDAIDGFRIDSLRLRYEQHGIEPPPDADLLNAIRAVQDAAVHLGGNVDPVECVWGIVCPQHQQKP